MIFTFVALCRLSGLSNEYQYEFSPHPPPPQAFLVSNNKANHLTKIVKIYKTIKKEIRILI